MLTRKTRCLALMAAMAAAFTLTPTGATAAQTSTMNWKSEFCLWTPYIKDRVVLLPYLNSNLKDVNPLFIKVVHLTADWINDAAIVFYPENPGTLPVPLGPETQWERKIIEVDGQNYEGVVSQLIQLLNGLDDSQAIAAKITFNTVGRYEDKTAKIRAAILWPK